MTPTSCPAPPGNAATQPNCEALQAKTQKETQESTFCYLWGLQTCEEILPGSSAKLSVRQEQRDERGGRGHLLVSLVLAEPVMCY